MTWVTPTSAATAAKTFPPHIDRIAKAGDRFTDCYANGSFWSPTRAALISCRYQHRFAVEDLGGPLTAQRLLH
jgi:arylsulfatase A-like enzyme